MSDGGKPIVLGAELLTPEERQQLRCDLEAWLKETNENGLTNEEIMRAWYHWFTKKPFGE